MSTSHATLTRLKSLSRAKSALHVNSWDTAIQKAKLRIQELKLAIVTFEGKKKAGEPWPEDEKAETAAESVSA